MFAAENGRRIAVTLSHLNMMGTVFYGAWSNVMLNFMSWQGICCLFPECTLERREILLSTSRRKRLAKYVRLYEKAGYRCVMNTEKCGELQGQRSVGDEFTKWWNLGGGEERIAVEWQVQFTVGSGEVRLRKEFDSVDEE